MKSFLKAVSALIHGEFRSRDSSGTPPIVRSDVRVRVELAQPDGKHLVVGELGRDGNEFVFTYDPRFAATPGALPLPGLPDLARTYRDEELFPFFAVRLPPARREDVREALLRLQIEEGDALRMLGALAKKAVSSPYEFELAEAR